MIIPIRNIKWEERHEELVTIILNPEAALLPRKELKLLMSKPHLVRPLMALLIIGEIKADASMRKRWGRRQ